MRRMFSTVLLAAMLWPACLAQASQKAETKPDALKLLEYDKSKPLDIQQVKTYEREGGVKVVDLTYASPVQGRVPALLVLPAGKGPFPAILFGHWGAGNRTEFLSEAELYAQAGAASLLVAYPWVRPKPWTRSVPNLDKPEQDLEIYAQAVVDLRRGLDLLLARDDVDAKRVAYVGHSYGAQWGAILTAADRRMKATVLVGGTPTIRDVWFNDDPETADVQEQNRAAIEKYVQANQPLDAVNFIGQAQVPLLFQFARFEQFISEAAMLRYWEAAPQPKQIQWYDTGHDLNDVRCLLDRAAFLEKQIGLKPFRPILEKKL